MVVDRDAQRLLGRLLPNHILVEELVDLLGLGQLRERRLSGLGQFLFDDLVAEVDALVADVDAWPGDELLDLLLALAAEGALQQVAVAYACHRVTLPICERPVNRTGPPYPASARLARSSCARHAVLHGQGELEQLT